MTSGMNGNGFLYSSLNKPSSANNLLLSSISFNKAPSPAISIELIIILYFDLGAYVERRPITKTSIPSSNLKLILFA